jgi:hypothetical protein
VKGNFHARFWIGGGEGDLLADHTKNARTGCGGRFTSTANTKHGTKVGSLHAASAPGTPVESVLVVGAWLLVTMQKNQPKGTPQVRRSSSVHTAT